LPDVAHFDIHGLRVTVEGDWPEVVEALRRDFAWWERSTPAPPDAHVTIARRPPDPAPYRSFAPVAVTERSVTYARDGVSVVDFAGRALAVRSGTTFAVESTDGYTARRAAFDFVLASAGAHLDRIGLPRVHGLGLAGAQDGVLVMLPSGGGKTTLAIHALRDGDVRLLSEGSPLLDAHGRLHAFPIPFWVRSTSAEAQELPPEHVRRLSGIEPDPLILELGAFRARVPAEPVPLRHLVLGRRSLGSAALARAGRGAAARPLLRESVAGFGFFQGLELLSRGRLPLPPRTATMRLRRVSRALASATVWELTLGTDKEENWSTLRRLLT
jgi:hypothetical protein